MLYGGVKAKGGNSIFFIIYNKDIPLAIFPLRKGIKRKYGIKIKVWETLLHNHLVFSNFIYDVNNNNKYILNSLNKIFIK